MPDCERNLLFMVEIGKMMQRGILWLTCLLCGNSVECIDLFGEQNFEVWRFGARLTVMEFRGKNSHLAMAIT